MRNDFGITEADYYNYLNEHNCYTVDGTDDKKDFEVSFDFKSVDLYLHMCLSTSRTRNTSYNFSVLKLKILILVTENCLEIEDVLKFECLCSNFLSAQIKF